MFSGLQSHVLCAKAVVVCPLPPAVLANLIPALSNQESRGDGLLRLV